MKSIPRGRSRTVAMTLAPGNGESFPGYLWRLADWNLIDKPRDLIMAADLRADNGRDFSALSDMRLRRFSEVARLDFETARTLFMGSYNQGVPPQWLRHQRPSVGRTLLNDFSHHRALWMLSPITFCHETWSHLLDRCPSCSTPFDWMVVTRKCCLSCDRALSVEDFPTVALELRSSLRRAISWLRAQDLPIDKDDVPGSSTLAGLTKGDLFQLAVLVGRALAKQNAAADLRIGQGAAGVSEPSMGVEAVMALDEFLTDLSPMQKNQRVPPFFRQLALSKRLVEGPLSVVLDKIVAPYDEESRGVQRLKAEREKAGAMTARQLAQQLKVERSTLKFIVERDKIKVSKKRGVSRRHVWFTQEHLQQASEFLGKRVSARVWMRSHHVTTIEMLQLADEGLLEILPPEEALDPTKVDLDRDVAAATVKAIMSHVIVAKPDRQWVRIERLFTCLGANHKPWGPLLVAAKQGKLKGKLLSREDHFSMSGLYIHRELADEFRLAILNETQPTFVAAGNRSVDWCPEMLRGEAECYLNVSCSEITWLARQGYFGDDAREGGPLRRSDVESLGQEFIGTREIATLAGCTTASVLGALRTLGVSPVIADVPFWRRRAVVGDGGAIHQIALTKGNWGRWASGQR